MATTEELIANEIKSVIETEIPTLKVVNFEDVKLAISDFADHELPAVQIWDAAQTIQHERHRILVNWSISVEIIMKSSENGAISQSDLWEMRRAVQRAIWKRPNLGIPGVVHSIYVGNVTDLHMVDPYYVSRIDLDVQFYDNLVSGA